MAIKKQRIYCEDSSSMYNTIKKEKHNGKQVIIAGKPCIMIGNDMVLNLKTNLIEYLK